MVVHQIDSRRYHPIAIASDDISVKVMAVSSNGSLGALTLPSFVANLSVTTSGAIIRNFLYINPIFQSNM